MCRCKISTVLKIVIIEFALVLNNSSYSFNTNWNNKNSLPLISYTPCVLHPLPLHPTPLTGHCYTVEIITKQLPTLGEKSTGSNPLQSNATIVLYLLLSSAWQKKTALWSSCFQGPNLHPWVLCTLLTISLFLSHQFFLNILTWSW